MIKLFFSSIFLFLSTFSNAALPVITTEIIALQGEQGEERKVNLLRFFKDEDDSSDSPTTITFSLSGNPDWISIDGINLKISNGDTVKGDTAEIKITATDNTNNSVHQNVKVFVPEHKKAENPNFPLIGIPYLNAGEYVIHYGINGDNPVIVDRVPLKGAKINCSAFIDGIPSVDDIRAERYDQKDLGDEYLKYMFPKARGQYPGTIPWGYVSGNKNYKELFSSEAATDQYKRLIQQNQVCEIRKFLESGRRFKEVYSEGHSDNSPDKVDELIGSQLTTTLSGYADSIESLVDDISYGGYGNNGYTVADVSEDIDIYNKDFSMFSSLVCDIYNGTEDDNLNAFENTATFKENPSFFKSEISKIMDISSGTISINAEDKDLWELSCMNVPSPTPRSHPRGRGVESAKALYSLGYRNIPQTKKDGEYDMGIQNLDFDRGYQKTTHFASVKNGANAYMSSGIQNGPSKFQYEDNPGELEDVVYDLVYKDMKRHKDFNSYVGNKSSKPEMKGLVMYPTIGIFDPGSIAVGGLDGVVNSTELMVANNKSIKIKIPKLSPGRVVRSDVSATGWDGNNEMKSFLSSRYIEYAPTILDLYKDGFNTDGGSCSKVGDSSCKFSFSLYLTDGGDAGIHFLPRPHIRDGAAFGGSPLKSENKSSQSKEYIDEGNGSVKINYLGLSDGGDSALTEFSQNKIDIYKDVVVEDEDEEGEITTRVVKVKDGEKTVDPQYKADLYYSLTYEEMKTKKFDYDLNGFAVILKPGYFKGNGSNYGIILKPNKNTFSPNEQEIFTELRSVIDDEKIINPTYKEEEVGNVEDIDEAVAVDGWSGSNIEKDFLNADRVSTSYTILDLYNKGYNWDSGKCSQSGDSSCIFAFSLYLNDANGGMYLKPVPKTTGGGHAAATTTIGSPLTKENQLSITVEKKDSGSRMNEIPNGYLKVGGNASSLSYVKGGPVKADYYYSLTYDQMYNGNFGYELDGLGILLPPGYFYSGETKRLNTYSFLQLKTPRYEKVDAGYDAYVFADSGNDLLGSTNKTGKVLISQPRVTPSRGYCLGLGLEYEDGYCVGNPCSTEGLKFNSQAGICEEDGSGFNIDAKEYMCSEPPEFKPLGVEELAESIRITENNQGSRLHQTMLDDGYCKTTIPVKRLPSSCKEIKDASPNSKSGEYYVFLSDKKAKVYCDMETDNGGWTLAIRDPDGLVPSPCAWCHADNVWPGSDLINPDRPAGELISKKWSRGPTLKVKNPYKGLPFYTMKPTSLLFKAYRNNNSGNPSYHPKKTQIFQGARKNSDNEFIPYQALSQAPIPTKSNRGDLFNHNNVSTYQHRHGISGYYSEELYVRDGGLPIRIKEIMNTPDRLASFTRNGLLADPRDPGDNEYYEYEKMPEANFPYLTTVLEAGENLRAEGKYILLVEAMDRINSDSREDLIDHSGRNIRVKVVVSEPGTYKYKYAAIHQNQSPDIQCDKKPTIEIKTQTNTYKKGLCMGDVAPNKIEWSEASFDTTVINEEIIIDVKAISIKPGDWTGMRFVIPFDQDGINFNNVTTGSFDRPDLCGPGYSLTADLSACQHTSYEQCPSVGTHLISNNGVYTCGKLPDNCSISELELETKEIEVDGKKVLNKEYGNCKFPAFSDTSIDVIKNISSRIFYNKYIKENSGSITPSDLDGLEISSEYKDTLINYEKNLNKDGKSIWDMDGDSGTYPNLNRALSLSSDYVNSSTLKKISDSYYIDNNSKKAFIKSVGLLKENLPIFALDSMAVTYGVMARRIRDLPGQFGTKISCMDGEIEAYSADYEMVCVSTQSGISDISRYKWNPIEQGQSANFKIEINGDAAKLSVDSRKSIMMDLENGIPISSTNLVSLIEREIEKDVVDQSNSLIRSVINCDNYKVTVSTTAITKYSDGDSNGEGVIYGGLNCKLPDMSYSNVAISSFKNTVEADESSSLEDLQVVSNLGLMDVNPQINSCRSDVGNGDGFGSYNFTTWRDGVSKQKYEKRKGFNSEIDLYIPKKLTTSYVRERETNAAAIEQIEKLIGTVVHNERGKLVTGKDENVIFDKKMGMMAGFLTIDGETYLANKVNDVIQRSFPYKSKDISISIPTDIFNSDVRLGTEDISNLSSLSLSVDDKYNDDLPALSTLLMDDDGYVGVRTDVIKGGAVAEYRADILDSGKEVSIKIPGFKKVLDGNLSDDENLLERMKSVFPQECSYMGVNGYKDEGEYSISNEYREGDEYVSTTKDDPEYKNINNFIFGPSEKRHYEYISEYGSSVYASKQIHLDDDVKVTFDYEMKFLDYLTKDADIWSQDINGTNPLSIEEYFNVINVESPTQQTMTCKVDIDDICKAGDTIPNEKIGDYYYSSSDSNDSINASLANQVSGEPIKIRNGDIFTVGRGEYLTVSVDNQYMYINDLKVLGTKKLLLGLSENISSIGNPQYESLYYRDTNEKFGDIKDLYFSRFSGGELSLSVDINSYNDLGGTTSGLNVRNKCDMVYGMPKSNIDDSGDVYYEPSISASISDEMVVDYQRDDIYRDSAQDVGDLSDGDMIANPNILSQLKCTSRGLAATGSNIYCNSSFEDALRFNEFKIKNIFNGDVALYGEAIKTVDADNFKSVNVSLGRLHRGENIDDVRFELNTNIDLNTITSAYTSSKSSSTYNVSAGDILGLIVEVLKYNPDYRLYIKGNGFDKSSTGTPTSFKMILNTDISNISKEMEISINVANNACLSVSNFDQSIIDEMKEKNKFYMVIKSMLDMNGVTAQLGMPRINDLGDKLKSGKMTQKYKFLKGWGSPSQGDIRRYYLSTVSAEDALIRYLMGYRALSGGNDSISVTGKCEEDPMYLSDSMEAGISPDERDGLFCKLAKDFMFEPSGGRYVFEPSDAEEIGVKIDIPKYKDFDFMGADGFNGSMMTGLASNGKMYEEQGIDFWKKTHHYKMNSRGNLFTQIMKGVALHEFEYKKQMSGIVNVDFLNDCTTGLSENGVYKANVRDLSLKRAFANNDGLKTLIPSVIALEGIDEYNNYNPIRSRVETDEVAAGYSVSSEGNGHIENNAVKLYRYDSKTGLGGKDAINFCQNIIKPRVLRGNDYLDSGNLEVLEGASSRGSAIINIKVPRAMANDEDNHMYRDLLGNPNWLQDKVCRDGYEDVGVRIHKGLLKNNPDLCDGGLASGHCAQGGPPTFGFLDAIAAMFGSKRIERAMNKYNSEGLMNIVEICGVGPVAASDVGYATPGDDTTKKKIVVYNGSQPKTVLEGNVLLEEGGVDKAKMSMQVLYSDSGCSNADECGEVNQSQRTLIINSINLFNTITNKKTGQDRTIGYKGVSGEDGLTLDTGSPIENLINSCMKFKAKVSYHKATAGAGFELDSSSTDKYGVCSVQPKKNLDRLSCRKSEGKWTSKVPLIKGYPNAKKDFSFVDPRNGQQRAVRSCSDIFVENEDVFDQEADDSAAKNRRKRDEMVRQFENSITGCSNTRDIKGEKDAKKIAEEVRNKKMKDLVLSCGINVKIDKNTDASDLLAKELSSFADASEGSYQDQSKDGVFRTKVGRDKDGSFGELKNRALESSDFTKTPTNNMSGNDIVNRQMDNLNNPGADPMSSFNSGLSALEGILDTIDMIPGVSVGSGMIKSVKTATNVAKAAQIATVVSKIKNAKDMMGGGAAVKAANEIDDYSFEGHLRNLSGLEMGVQDMTVGQYVDEVINFDKSINREADKQIHKESMMESEYKRRKREYDAAMMDAEDKFNSHSGGSLRAGIESRAGSLENNKYKHESISVGGFGDDYYTKESARNNFYSEDESKEYYKNLEDNSNSSIQKDYYNMQNSDYQDDIVPGAVDNFTNENTAEDRNVDNAYGKFSDLADLNKEGGKSDNKVKDYLNEQSNEYMNYQRNQTGIMIEGFVR